MRRPLLILVSLAASVIGAGLVPGVAAADNSQGPIVQFTTSLGNIDVQLLSQSAPNTVANFLSYVNAGAYNTTFFHRSVTPSQTSPFDILQGGSYDVVSGQRQTIPTNPPIALEYNLPNSAGTLAMARTSDPNSATSGWFFNVTDDTSTFGPSNGGGYAVFGQILSPAGVQVMNTIAAQTVIDDSAAGSQYATLPVRNYSGTLTTANLIMSPITVVNDTTAPTITITQPTNGELFTQGYAFTPQYTCTDPKNADGTDGTGVASCTSSTFDTSTPGQKTFTVSSTDYAGNATTTSVAYTVNPAPPGPTPITPPPAPKPGAVAPTLSGSLIAARSGKLPMTLRCTTAARCTGSVTVTIAAAHHRTLRVASGHYAIAGRRSAKLTLRLGSATMKLLRAHKHLALTLTLAPAGGRKHTRRVTLRLGAH